MGKARKPRTVEQLVKAGYIPRELAVKQLREWADGVENGSADLFIRSPERQPGLWVKFGLQMWFENVDEAIPSKEQHG